MMGTIQGQDRAFRGLKKFSGGGRESDYSVCPHPLLQFLQFFSVYVRLRQFTSEGQDVELDNIQSIVAAKIKGGPKNYWIVKIDQRCIIFGSLKNPQRWNGTYISVNPFF